LAWYVIGLVSEAFLGSFLFDAIAIAEIRRLIHVEPYAIQFEAIAVGQVVEHVAPPFVGIVFVEVREVGVSTPDSCSEWLV